MPLFYNKVQRVNPLKKDEPHKWYPVLKSLGLVGEKEVARQIADETTLNPKEAEMALAQLEKVLISLLLNGNTVRIGDWGTFQLTLNAEGAEKAEDVTPAKIKKVNIRFQAGKTLKEAIDKATFRQASDLVAKR